MLQHRAADFQFSRARMAQNPPTLRSSSTSVMDRSPSPSSSLPYEFHLDPPLRNPHAVGGRSDCRAGFNLCRVVS